MSMLAKRTRPETAKRNAFSPFLARPGLLIILMETWGVVSVHAVLDLANQYTTMGQRAPRHDVILVKLGITSRVPVVRKSFEAGSFPRMEGGIGILIFKILLI